MDIRKIGKFKHASLIVVGSVVPVNRQFYAAAGCSARLSLYFRAGADARSAARELAGGGPPWRAAGGRDLRLPLRLPVTRNGGKARPAAVGRSPPYVVHRRSPSAQHFVLSASGFHTRW